MIDEVKVLIVIILGLLVLNYLYPDLFSWLYSRSFTNEANEKKPNQEDNSEQFGVVNNVSKNVNNVNPPDSDINNLTLNGAVGVNKPMDFNNASFGDNYFIDVGEVGTSLSNAMCSKSCCSPQYPLPFSLPTDKMVCNSGEKYVSSGITCNNGWQDTGCLCMTEDQANFLATRGKNA